MTLDFRKLNVASLNYADIVASLKTFLKSEPSLSSLDFDNDASAINMLCNILATGVAYNGIYSQFGYHESFLSTATLLESIVGLSSNSSVLLEVKKSAKVSNSVSISSAGLSAYTPFNATAVDGTTILFFNTVGLTSDTETTVDLYSGSAMVQYTDWDFNTQSIVLPLTVDPETINLYSVDVYGTETTWTRLDKSSFSASLGNYYTVLNTVNGYLVTANLPESNPLDSTLTVYVKAVTTNGSIGNGAIITPASGVTFLTNNTPSGGYDTISVDLAKAKVQFAASSEHRCVTLEDYENAILQSGIPGTDDITKITVANGSVPCQVKVYVNGLSGDNQSALMVYLGIRAVAGINLIYSL